MKLIVGLGNPGEKYEKTRHNVGFIILDHFLKDFSSADKSSFKDSSKFKSSIFILDWQPKKAAAERVILAKPKTFMNNSGQAVFLIASFYKIKPSDIWVVHDDIDLPLSAMKIRLGGGTAGHHGIESIMESLKSEMFWRFRVGIGDQKGKFPSKKLKPIDDFVLGKFVEGEMGKIRESTKRSVKALEDALEEGLERAANRYNTK